MCSCGLKKRPVGEERHMTVIIPKTCLEVATVLWQKAKN